MQRFIIEMGQGLDQYGQDFTKAAARAIDDAIGKTAIPLFDATGVPHTEMEVRVTIGVTQPDQVDTDALADRLPRGRATVTATQGGLDVTNPDTGNTIIVATAAVEAFLPYQGEAAHQGG